MVVDAGGIRPDDLVVESSNARKIIVIDNLHELSWGGCGHSEGADHRTH